LQLLQIADVKTEKPKKKYLTSGISFPDPELLERAQARARSLAIDFSTYARLLIKQDVEKGGPLTLGEVRVFPEHVYPEQLAEAAAISEGKLSSSAAAGGGKSDKEAGRVIQLRTVYLPDKPKRGGGAAAPTGQGPGLKRPAPGE
jgi:hypothetical protein